MAGRVPFVGRKRELSEFAASLDELRAGRGGVVLVGGDPGVGKTRLLEELAVDDSRVLIFEDLHDADATTLAAFELAARQAADAPFLVVGTYRNDALPLTHPLVACLAGLHRGRLETRVQLSPLDERETRQLVEALGGDSLDAGRIFALTGGNPFLVEELVQVGGERIPGTVREAVGRRVAGSSPAAQRLLSVTSAFAEPFDFRVFELLTGLPEEDLLDALDEALAAGLVRPAPGRPDGYEFAQELVRQTLYEELSPSRRARLHRRIVLVLEALPGEHAAELAVQYSRSASLPGAANGVPYALAAARASEGEERDRFLSIAAELARDADDSVRAEIRAARAESAARSDGLTPREVEVLRLLAEGRSTKEIARELVVSAYTVDRHVANIYGKIGTHNRAAATAYAHAAGVVQVY